MVCIWSRRYLWTNIDKSVYASINGRNKEKKQKDGIKQVSQFYKWEMNVGNVCLWKGMKKKGAWRIYHLDWTTFKRAAHWKNWKHFRKKIIIIIIEEEKRERNNNNIMNSLYLKNLLCAAHIRTNSAHSSYMYAAALVVPFFRILKIIIIVEIA